MSKSKKRNKDSTNKGYPRWVAEKYGLASDSDDANQQTQNMTAPHSEREPGMTASQQTNVEIEAAGGTGGTPAGVSLASTLTAPREAAQQPAQTSLSNNLQMDGTVPNAEVVATEDKQRRVGGRSDKRNAPQSIAEFIEAFLAGKVKSLSEPVARCLKSSSPHLEPDVSGNLLRNAQSVDGTLDKVRKLMLVAQELSSHKSLAHVVMNFCVNCVLTNPFIRAEGMRPLLFPGTEDSSSLEEAWAALQSLPIPSDANASLDESEAGPPHDNLPNSEEATKSNTSKGNATKSPRSAVALANRSRRNALLCAAIWRVQQGQMAFPEMVRALRATLFLLRKRPQSLDDELLEALASISDKDAEPVTLLLEWNARQQTEALNRLADVNRTARVLDDEVRDLKERLAVALTQADTLHRQLADERAAGQALQKALGVAKTHGQADLEGLRALALNTLRDAVSQLDVVSEALKREPPKVLSALDKVDAVMDRLKATNEKLENT